MDPGTFRGGTIRSGTVRGISLDGMIPCEMDPCEMDLCEMDHEICRCRRHEETDRGTFRGETNPHFETECGVLRGTDREIYRGTCAIRSICATRIGIPFPDDPRLAAGATATF